MPRLKPLTGPGCSRPLFPAAPCLAPPFPPSRRQPLPAAPPAVVAIGVSTGGPAALDILLPALPADFPLPVLVVQHMPELFTTLFAERLNRRCQLHVREASEGDPVHPGNHLHRPRQLAHGGARAAARRLAGHPAPQPGPAGKPLPPRRRRALSLRRQSLRHRRPRRRAHRHGLRRPARAAASFATRAAACWPRTRPPAPSGECPAPSRRQAWRTRCCPSTPSCRKSSASLAAPRPAAPEARNASPGWWCSDGIRRSRRLRLSSPTRLRHLAKRARPLARLSLRDPPHQAPAQPGHEPPGRAGEQPARLKKSRP